MSINTQDRYLKIESYSLRPDTIVPFNIYRKTENSYTLVVENRDYFPKSLSSLVQNSSFYIDVSDENKYHYYLGNVLSEITKDKTIPLKEKTKFIYNASSKVITDICENPDSKDALDRSRNILSSSIDVVLLEGDSVMKSFLELSSVDYYVYTHSVDVSIFTIAFANYLKFSKRDISNIGYASLLHDIGKSKIASKIIHKKEDLTLQEKDLVKKHPLYGFHILKKHGEKNDDILKTIRNHHEKAKGNGYPDKLISSRTHTFAKIVAITNIFSNLTTNRPYKKAYSSFEALSIMKKNMLEDIDKNLFIDFVKFMSSSSR